MVNAIILLDVEFPHIGEVAEKLAMEAGVDAVYSVAGPHDVVAQVRMPSNEALAELVTQRLGRLPGIRSSRTLIAFRVYSSKQLDAAFDLGGD
jgi:DNA-binding Lrp family transcriptional regulator